MSYKDALIHAKSHYRKGSGLGSSRPANQDDNYDGVVNFERTRKPNDKPINRSVIDKLAVPYSSKKSKEIETENQRKQSNKIYHNK